MFCLTFFVHNFLIAPLLVYHNRKWMYAIATSLLMASFTAYQLNCRPCGHRPEQTKYTIEVLSKLMRYVLYEGNKTMAPLQKELDFIRHYVAFMRIHKSYIINLNHIAEININRVMLDNGKGFPIGESYREKLTNYVNRKFLGK